MKGKNRIDTATLYFFNSCNCAQEKDTPATWEYTIVAFAYSNDECVRGYL